MNIYKLKENFKSDYNCFYNNYVVIDNIENEKLIKLIMKNSFCYDTEKLKVYMNQKEKELTDQIDPTIPIYDEITETNYNTAYEYLKETEPFYSECARVIEALEDKYYLNFDGKSKEYYGFIYYNYELLVQEGII